MRTIQLIITSTILLLIYTATFAQTDALLGPSKGQEFIKDNDKCRIDFYKHKADDTTDGIINPENNHLYIKVDYDGEDNDNDNIVINSSGLLTIGADTDVLCGGYLASDIIDEVGSNDLKLVVHGQTATSTGENTWTTFSDQRLKKNIKSLNHSLSLLKQVKFYEYEYNGQANTKTGKKYYGVLAQEIQNIIPSTVKTMRTQLNPRDTKRTEVLAFNPSDLIYVGLNATKELAYSFEAEQASHTETKEELSEVKVQLKTVEEKNEQLEERVASLENKLSLLLQIQPNKEGTQKVEFQHSKLLQNVPNPTMGATMIPYFIAQDVHNAKIIVNDLAGLLIDEFEIKQRGNGEYYLDLNRLAAKNSTYTYSLILDNKLFDTKKIVYLR